MHGQTIFEVQQRILRSRRRTFVGTALVVILFMVGIGYNEFFMEGRMHIEADMVVFPLGSLAAFIFLSLGLKQNGFALTTEGIYPPSKPYRRLFSGRYYVPYSEIATMDLKYLPYYDSGKKAQDTHPHAAILHLMDRKVVYVNVVGGWTPMYFYVKSETTLRGIYRMLEVIKREIDGQRSKGVKEIVIDAQKLKNAMNPGKGEKYAD